MEVRLCSRNRCCRLLSGKVRSASATFGWSKSNSVDINHHQPPPPPHFSHFPSSLSLPFLFQFHTPNKKPNTTTTKTRRKFCGPHCAMDEVKTTSAWVATRSSHVFVESSVLDKVVDEIQGAIPKVEWDFEGIHYFDNGPLTVQYLFVLDALNFCFWPDKDLNYDDLASGLKVALQNDKSAFDADRLQSYTGPQLRKLLNWPHPLPLEDERIRLLHEVGSELERSFSGKAANLVEACGKSAVSLVSLITRHFPGFRDHSVYKGHQVFLYKRAQIFASDLWGAFKGQGYGEFYDIGSITIFADYIVPAVLRQLGVLRYSSALASIVDSNNEIGSGSEEEVEIRACTIYAVEKMKDLIKAKSGKEVLSVELDLWLWSYGVQSQSLRHHRTLSIYY